MRLIAQIAQPIRTFKVIPARNLTFEFSSQGFSLIEKYGNHKVKTHVTTNLNAQELEDRYDNRVRSKILAMFNLNAFSSLCSDKHL